MPDLLHTTKVKSARKMHRCRICHGPAVQPGQSYERQTLIYDGRIYDWVQCDPCGDLFATVYDWAGAWGDEGIGSEHFEEWASDFKDDPDHGEAARAFLKRAFPSEEASDV